MPPLVMLVEDERHISQVVERRLVGQGYDVVIARDGMQALELAEDRTPSAIVTDLEMPRMNGLELLAALREHETLSDVPVIMLTARGHLAANGDIPEVVRVVAKPFSARKLVEAVAELLRVGNANEASTNREAA